MPNYTRAAEITRLRRGDKINVIQFEFFLRSNQFLIFPAVRLQAMMREQFGGKSLWERAIQIREEKMAHERDLEEKRKQEEAAKQQEIAEQKKKLDYYTNKKQRWLMAYWKKQQDLNHPLRYIRVHRRRASEGTIGFNVQSLFREAMHPV